MKFDLGKLVAAGYTPAQINLLLDLNHQRKVSQSNVVLSPEEVALHRARFQAKTYANRLELPLNTRAARKVECAINRNKKKEQVEE